MSDLLVVAMEREGVHAEEARKKIFLVDSKGLVVKVKLNFEVLFFIFELFSFCFSQKDRPTGGLNEEKKRYAHVHEPIVGLNDIVRKIKPSFLIGEKNKNSFEFCSF